MRHFGHDDKAAMAVLAAAPGKPALVRGGAENEVLRVSHKKPLPWVRTPAELPRHNVFLVCRFLIKVSHKAVKRKITIFMILFWAPETGPGPCQRSWPIARRRRHRAIQARPGPIARR